MEVWGRREEGGREGEKITSSVRCCTFTCTYVQYTMHVRLWSHLYTNQAQLHACTCTFCSFSLCRRDRLGHGEKVSANHGVVRAKVNELHKVVA